MLKKINLLGGTDCGTYLRRMLALLLTKYFTLPFNDLIWKSADTNKEKLFFQHVK